MSTAIYFHFPDLDRQPWTPDAPVHIPREGERVDFSRAGGAFERYQVAQVISVFSGGTLSRIDLHLERVATWSTPPLRSTDSGPP